MMTGDDPHADRYPAAPAINDRATSPPALARMHADRVEAVIRFSDGSAYLAEFGPCWADLGRLTERPGGLPRYIGLGGPAWPELPDRAMQLTLHQRMPADGSLLTAPAIGTIRVLAPGKAAASALGAERAASLAEPVPPAGVDPATAAALIAKLRDAVANGWGWQVNREMAAALLAIVTGGPG